MIETEEGHGSKQTDGNGKMTLDGFLKKLRKIEFHTKTRSHELLSGTYHSAFKGQGMHFSECKAYEEGDDVRYIDWNATARQSGVFVKQFIEERELSVYVLLDLSRSMQFGSIAMTKAEKAIEAMAFIAFSALHNNDRVGLILFNETGYRIIPQCKGKKKIVHLLTESLQFDPVPDPVSFPEILYKTLMFLKRRSLVFVISDFITDDYEMSLRHLAHHHEVIPVVVSDPLESRMSDLGLTVLEDAVTHELIVADTSQETFAQDYHREFERRQRLQHAHFSHANLTYLRISTDEEIYGLLARTFERRAGHV